MKKSAKVSTFCAVICLFLFLAISGSASGIQHVSMYHGIFSNSIQAGFTEGAYGSGDYDTDTDKIVKQCYVRLIEGNYDSGRKYSDVGGKTRGDFIWTDTVSKCNNLFCTCYTYYGWLYY